MSSEARRAQIETNTNISRQVWEDRGKKTPEDDGLAPSCMGILLAAVFVWAVVSYFLATISQVSQSDALRVPVQKVSEAACV